MANLERGFRRLTSAFSLLCASSFLVDGVLSFFETGRAHHYLLVPTAIGFEKPPSRVNFPGNRDARATDQH
jgi:hypothetical protein